MLNATAGTRYNPLAYPAVMIISRELVFPKTFARSSSDLTSGERHYKFVHPSVVAPNIVTPQRPDIIVLAGLFQRILQRVCLSFLPNLGRLSKSPG